MPEGPESDVTRRDASDHDAAADAFTHWLLTADTADLNNIGMRRITRIWFDAWEAATRHARGGESPDDDPDGWTEDA